MRVGSSQEPCPARWLRIGVAGRDTGRNPASAGEQCSQGGIVLAVPPTLAQERAQGILSRTLRWLERIDEFAIEPGADARQGIEGGKPLRPDPLQDGIDGS